MNRSFVRQLNSLSLLRSSVAIAMFAFCGQLQGQDFWQNNTFTNAEWNNPSNWADGTVPTAGETTNFDLNSNYEVWWNGSTGDTAAGPLNINQGAVTFRDNSPPFPPLRSHSVNGDVNIHAGLTLNRMKLIPQGLISIMGSSAQLTKLNLSESEITFNPPNSGAFIIGQSGQTGSATLSNASHVTTNITTIGLFNNSEGMLTVGSGCSWTCTSGLRVGELGGDGILDVLGGGSLNTENCIVGTEANSNGCANISGIWNNQFGLRIGYMGTGELNISSGGMVSNAFTVVGTMADSLGTATVSGPGASWNTANDFEIGIAGTGVLDISDLGQVIVGGLTTIGANGTVNLSGGSFEFGESELSQFSNVNAESGQLVGDLLGTSVADVESLTFLSDDQVDVDGVNLFNQSTIYGDGSLNVGLLENSLTGELEVLSKERMRLPFASCVNGGEINNFGGEFRVGEFIANGPTGLIGGRGVFVADSGWFNDGVIALSGGFADVLGDVTNAPIGDIAVGGNCIATFYDDVVMDPANMNINVASGSTAVFFGSYNGGNSGSGTIEAFGDLRPGNSPALVTFGGDLFLGNTATTEIELGGTESGEYDELVVQGDLNIGGNLSVSLINGFELQLGQRFLVADAVSTSAGQFANYDEGDWVGDFAGVDLFITYVGGDGNDTVLYVLPIGDANGDGLLNNSDIATFVLALTNSVVYEAMFPNVNPDSVLDMDGNGVFNNADIAGFVAALTGN